MLTEGQDGAALGPLNLRWSLMGLTGNGSINRKIDLTILSYLTIFLLSSKKTSAGCSAVREEFKHIDQRFGKRGELKKISISEK